MAPLSFYSNVIHYSSLNVNLFFRVRRFLPHVSTVPFQLPSSSGSRYE